MHKLLLERKARSLHLQLEHADKKEYKSRQSTDHSCAIALNYVLRACYLMCASFTLQFVTASRHGTMGDNNAPVRFSTCQERNTAKKHQYFILQTVPRAGGMAKMSGRGPGQRVTGCMTNYNTTSNHMYPDCKFVFVAHSYVLKKLRILYVPELALFVVHKAVTFC